MCGGGSRNHINYVWIRGTNYRMRPNTNAGKRLINKNQKRICAHQQKPENAWKSIMFCGELNLDAGRLLAVAFYVSAEGSVVGNLFPMHVRCETH